MSGSCQPPGVLRRREAALQLGRCLPGGGGGGGGKVHAAASRLAACCNVWWRLQHPVRVCSWGNLGPARRSVCGSQAARPGGCWHLASHLQLRVQPQVSGAGDITAFVYRSAGGRKRGRSLEREGTFSLPRPHRVRPQPGPSPSALAPSRPRPDSRPPPPQPAPPEAWAFLLCLSWARTALSLCLLVSFCPLCVPAAPLLSSRLAGLALDSLTGRCLHCPAPGSGAPSPALANPRRSRPLA